MVKSNVGQFVKTTIIGTAISACFASNYATADMNTPMQAIFGEMTTSTAPGKYENSLGTTLYLGSIKSRTPIVNLQPLMTVQPPNIRGGCGGFDLTAGSIGFISGEELANFVKGIASNAQNLLIYAFMMAIKSQCQACSDMMSWLNDLSQMVNQNNLNSCDAAKRILTGDVKLDPEKFTDNLKASMKKYKLFGGGTEEVKAEQELGTPGFLAAVLGSDVNAKLGGNIIFNELNNQRVASWFGMAEGSQDAQEFYEAVMSLTGAVYVGYKGADGKSCVPKESDSDTQACKMDLKPYPATLGLREFYEGAEQKDVRKCESPLDSNDSCSNPQLDKMNILPFKERFNSVFVGPGNLLEKMATPDQKLTESQKGLMANLSKYSESITLLRSLSKDPSTLESFYARTSSVMSLEMTYALVKAILTTTRQSVSVSDKVANKEALKLLDKRIGELQVEYEVLLKEQDTKTEDMKLHNLYTQMLKNKG